MSFAGFKALLHRGKQLLFIYGFGYVGVESFVHYLFLVRRERVGRYCDYGVRLPLSRIRRVASCPSIPGYAYVHKDEVRIVF